MTAAPSTGQAHPATLPQPRVRRSWYHPRYLLTALALAAAEAAGLAALAHAYQLAATTVSSEPEFTWFWAGMALMVLPLAGLAGRRAASPAMRTGLLILYGIVSFAPKLLRDPASPIFHDEFAHWRQTESILRTGELFRQNPIVPIAARYPGLHATTASLVSMTGLSIWQAATLLMLCLHVVLVLGVAGLAGAVGLGSRAAALAALLYGLNPSFLYFDTQFAYESMAITLVMWALTGYVRAVCARTGRGRAEWGVLTVVLAAATVVTHHLSSVFLIVIVTIAAVALSTPPLARAAGSARTAVTAWTLTLAIAAMTACWFSFAAPGTLGYLSPYPGAGFGELLHAIEGAGSGRHLFAASLSPQWEQAAAYLTTLLALGFAVAGLLMLWSLARRGALPRGPQRALRAAFALLGLVYFPSTLFIFSPSGAEGARRSWAFSWIGLSLLAAPAAVALAGWAGRRRARLARHCAALVLGAALAVALVGGTAAGLDASYRFPGPFLYGSDARSITPELTAAGAWFRTRYGPGHNIVTDRYTALVFGSFGLQNPGTSSPGFPIYELYLARPGAPISRSLLAELSSSHFGYLVVDRRMAYELPELGVYFSADDPGTLLPAHGSTPVFRGRLAKFNRLPWLVKIFQSDNYRIYRLDLGPGQTGYQRPAPALRGRLSVTS